MSKRLPGSTSSSSSSSRVERERCDYRVRPSLKVAVDVGAGMKMRLARPAQYLLLNIIARDSVLYVAIYSAILA